MTLPRLTAALWAAAALFVAGDLYIATGHLVAFLAFWTLLWAYIWTIGYLALRVADNDYRAVGRAAVQRPAWTFASYGEVAR